VSTPTINAWQRPQFVLGQGISGIAVDQHLKGALGIVGRAVLEQEHATAAQCLEVVGPLHGCLIPRVASLGEPPERDGGPTLN
jgi:hypothetical protein